MGIGTLFLQSVGVYGLVWVPNFYGQEPVWVPNLYGQLGFMGTGEGTQFLWAVGLDNNTQPTTIPHRLLQSPADYNSQSPNMAYCITNTQTHQLSPLAPSITVHFVTPLFSLTWA